MQHTRQPCNHFFTTIFSPNFLYCIHFLHFIGLKIQMKKPKVFQLLQKMSGHEHKALNRFVASSANCPREDVRKLYQTWYKSKHNFRGETLWPAVYPQRAFHLRQWRLLVSRLQKVVDHYLVASSAEEQPGIRDYLLMLAYRKRQSPYFFRRIYKKSLKREAQAPYDIPALLHKWQLEDAYYDYLASPDRQQRTNLQETSDSLDHFFIANKLKQACLAHSRYLARQEDYEIKLLPLALQAIAQQPALLQIPAIAVYHACYQAVVQEGGIHEFEHLRRTMEQYQAGFSRASARDIYLLATNYCIRRFNEGEERFGAEALNLYQTALSENLLVEDGYLAESTFSNIVMLGIYAEAFDWVSGFIQEYTDKLPPKYRKALEAYSLGRLAYAQGAYTKALRQLAQVTAQAPFLYLGTKTIQIKACYEAKDLQTAEHLLYSLQAYLHRNKRLSYRRTHYLTVVQFMRRLLQLPAFDASAKQQLITDIKDAKFLLDKAWFLDQLQEAG